MDSQLPSPDSASPTEFWPESLIDGLIGYNSLEELHQSVEDYKKVVQDLTKHSRILMDESREALNRCNVERQLSRYFKQVHHDDRLPGSELL